MGRYLLLLWTKLVSFILWPLKEGNSTLRSAALDCSLTEYCATNNVTPTEAAQRMRDQVKLETGMYFF